MRSLLIEFHRFNDLETGILRRGDRYLVAAASHPVRPYEMPLDHVPFLRLMRALRYEKGAQEREEALAEMRRIVTAMLGTADLDELRGGESPLQLDLVVNAAELAALPFEVASDGRGQPLLVQTDRIVELTRRVRHDFAETRVRWPARPRILYAWASPLGAGSVPSDEHEKALRAALLPWIPVQEGTGVTPDASGVLTTLANASIAALEKACRDSVSQNKPFTHVHLLAHGYPIGDVFEQRFGMALHDAASGELQAATPEEVRQALAPLSGYPVIVTMATCDAASAANPIVPERSIAHELHVSGFPVVIASQLPFTKPGSTIMVETFYAALLAGRDVRVALHETRVALYEKREHAGHDWASLVGYVRLPEGYADHLRDVGLEAVLAALKTAQGWSDELVKRGEKDAALFGHVADVLRGRIQVLESLLQDTEKAEQRGVLVENLGLLGSAEKRLAELCFVRSGLGDAAHWREEMRKALERSRDWYRQGYESNLSHHWTGVQYLSLEAVLDGKIAHPSRWHAAVSAAEIDRRRPGEFWAQGSLAELYLLAPLAGVTADARAAADVLEEMKGRVKAHGKGDLFPLESTERQLRRYVHWWTTSNRFFPGTSDLAAEAERLLAELRR